MVVSRLKATVRMCSPMHGDNLVAMIMRTRNLALAGGASLLGAFALLGLQNENRNSRNPNSRLETFSISRFADAMLCHTHRHLTELKLKVHQLKDLCLVAVPLSLEERVQTFLQHAQALVPSKFSITQILLQVGSSSLALETSALSTINLSPDTHEHVPVRDITVPLTEEQELADENRLKTYWPTDPQKAEAAERMVLRHIGAPYRKLRVRIEQPNSSKGVIGKDKQSTGHGCGAYINTVVIGNGPKKVVLCHGYGQGAGFWYPTLAGLAQKNDEYTFYAVDMLGFGLSSRPEFPAANDAKQRAEEAEDFFVESMERWRDSLGIDKFILIGHSLGGFMSGVYSLRHPERVQKLVLVSPGAVSGYSSDEERQAHAEVGLPHKVMRRLAKWNVTPSAIMRTFGPTGPALVRKYMDSRHGYLPTGIRTDLSRYMYHTNASAASGEYALQAVFIPQKGGNYGHNPLGPRLKGLRMPTTFFYGDRDSMNVEAAYDAVYKMNVSTRVHIVPCAGHNLYLDNPTWFNRELLSELDDAQ